MQSKNFSMKLLKESSSIWVPELVSNLDIFLDQIEATLSTSSSASYMFPLQQFLFKFLFKVLAKADTSLDPKIAESGYSMLNKWLALQLLPTISIGKVQPLEELFLHSFSYPFSLVKGDYNNLYNFVKQHGNVSSILNCISNDFLLDVKFYIHNLLLIVVFNQTVNFVIELSYVASVSL